VSPPILVPADPSALTLASVLIESLHLADPAAQEFRLHGLVGEGFLALLADHDPVRLSEHLGQVVKRDILGQVVVPVAAAVERYKRRPAQTRDSSVNVGSSP
jgi:hypothetical protein